MVCEVSLGKAGLDLCRLVTRVVSSFYERLHLLYTFQACVLELVNQLCSTGDDEKLNKFCL